MATCYRVPVQEHFEWQQSVISRTSTPPGSPSRGDRYLVTAGATGAWTGYDNYIAYCTDASGPTWAFTAPDDGMITYVEDKNKYYDWDGSKWRPHGYDDAVDARRYALLVGAP
jgi:hypothetical protein